MANLKNYLSVHKFNKKFWFSTTRIAVILYFTRLCLYVFYIYFNLNSQNPEIDLLWLRFVNEKN